MKSPASGRRSLEGFLIGIAIASLGLLLARDALADTCTWTGATNTAWKTTGNWSGCTTAPNYPDTGDTAVINSVANHPVIAVADNITLSALTINAGTSVTVNGHLTLQGTSGGSGDLSVTSTGTLSWTAGTLNGSGATTIASGGTLDLTSGTRILDGRNLTNSGTTTFAGAGYFYLANSAVFNNAAGGNFEIQNDYGIYPSGSPAGTFTNAGTFTRSTSSGLATVNVPFTNTGTVNVTSGSLVFSGVGTQTHSGPFNSTGGTLRFSAGNHTFNGSLGGTNVVFEGGQEVVNSTYNVTGTTTVVGANPVTFNAASTVTSIGSSLLVSSGTINLNSGSAITPTTMNLTGGTVGGSDVITVSGLFMFNGGTLGGSGAFNANGGIDMSSGTRTLDTRTLHNGGTATLSAVGYFYLANSGLFDNKVGATFDAQSDYGVYPSGSPSGTFTNAGTFTRTTSAATFTFNVPFTNSGTVTVNSGTLTFSGAGTQTHSGSFNSTGGTLRFSAGNHTFNGSLGGTNIIFDGGQEVVNGTYNVTGTTTVAGASPVTFNVASTVTSIGTSLVVSSGTINLNSGSAITPTTLNLTGGTVGGSDVITVSGLFTFNGGTLGGSGAFNANGGIDMSSGTRTLDTRTLHNGGTATFSAVGYFYLANSGLFDNKVGATFDAQSDYGVYPSGSPSGTFTNAGTFTRSTSAATFTFNAPFTNSGTVTVNSGTLTFSGAGTQTHSGSFNSTGATLRFNSGNHTFNGSLGGTNIAFDGGQAVVNSTYNVTGTTTVAGVSPITFNVASTVTSIGSSLVVSGGTVNFNSGSVITPTTMNMTGGTVGGSDVITVSGLFTFNGGTLGGSGAFNANGGIEMSSGTRTLDTRTLHNGGTATFSAVGYFYLANGGLFDNKVGAAFDAQSDYGAYPSGSPSGTFTNAGTFTRSTSAGIFTFNAPFTNTGTVDVQSGTLNFSGTFTQTAGATHLSGGTLQTPFSTTLNIQGGILDGNGNIDGNVAISASGQFNPGTSPGEIAIINNHTYTQSNPGVLNIDVNGMTPGFDFDRVLISGAATLGGELKVSLGYSPTLGDSFTILTHASRSGTFSKLTFPSPGAGLGWDVGYTATSTTLTIANLLASAPVRVDAHAGTGTSSDGNGILEPGERVVVEPSWQNMTESGITSAGTASNFAGPAGATYSLPDTSSNYGTITADSTTDCFTATGDCFQVQVSAPATRPTTHWDTTVKETLTGGTNKTWTLHVGDSFVDVPRSQSFYQKIETLLHTGITGGCDTTHYCPGQVVNRGQMAIFVAKGIAGGGPNVPNSGSVVVNGTPKPYNCVAGGTSIFTDVAPTAIYCKHVHYIAAQNVTLGCTASTYCPDATVTRDAMAAFIAKAILAPGGGTAVPLTYGPDPVTGFSYNCSFGPVHFSDVPTSNVYCKHIHYLWARGIVTGCSPTTYCPPAAVTRDAMAKFLANAFNLLLYGPVP